VFAVLSNENYNINQVVQGLEEELAFYEEKTVVDQKSYEDAYVEHTKMQEAYHVARNINERFIELQQKESVLDGLSEQQSFMEQQEKRLADAERAVSIEEIEKQFTALQKEVMYK